VNSYTDPFVTLTEGQGAFFGNRSFVIHFANTTRYTCANFVSAQKALEGGFPHPSGGRKPSGLQPKVTKSIVPGVGGPVPTAGGSPNGAGGFASAFGFSNGGFPTSFPGGPGGFVSYGKPAVEGPNAFSIPDGGDLSSLFSGIGASYTSYWASLSSTAAAAAAATITDAPSSSILASASSAATSTDYLPPLPSTVTASGFNISTSLLPSASRTAAPVVFTDGASVLSVTKVFGCVVALIVVALFSF
jgi:hypothetical protein